MLLAAAVMLVCCVRPQASGNQQSAVSDQQPADSEQSDSTAVEEILTAQRSVFKSQDEMINFVKADSNRWVQHEFGWWYRYVHKSEAHVEYNLIAPATDTCIIIHERARTLDGTLIVDAIREFDTSGTYQMDEEPFVYEIMLRELVPEDTIVMLVPWSAAYGKKGKGVVPPETDLHIELTIERLPYREVETVES